MPKKIFLVLDQLAPRADTDTDPFGSINRAIQSLDPRMADPHTIVGGQAAHQNSVRAQAQLHDRLNHCVQSLDDVSFSHSMGVCLRYWWPVFWANQINPRIIWIVNDGPGRKDASEDIHDWVRRILYGLDALLTDRPVVISTEKFGATRSLSKAEAQAIVSGKNNGNAASITSGQISSAGKTDLPRILIQIARGWANTPLPHRLRLLECAKNRAAELYNLTLINDAQPIYGEPANAHSLLHYHLFKNAGTSFDLLLRKAYDGRWHTQEFPPRAGLDPSALAQWVCKVGPADSGQALSSHTAAALPCVAEHPVFPAFFVRQPLERLRSAYDFESHQRDDTPGALLARSTDITGYLQKRLDAKGDNFCQNFQARRLAKLVPSPGLSLRLRASAAVRFFPFNGCVERFEQSLCDMRPLFQVLGISLPENPVHANRTIRQTTLKAGNSASLKQMIPQTLFKTLVQENAIDQFLIQKYDQLRQ